MPANPDNTQFTSDCTLSPTLADNLHEVARIIASGMRQSDPADCDASALALVRILPGIQPEVWEAFASSHGLEDWLGFSLGQDVAASVQHLLSMQSRLAFQRDHDALTGIGNRGFFDRRITAEVERATRSRTELSLLYLDLDNFKKVNDTYGHSCGDLVLQRLAKVLQSSVRAYDIAARIGGEEFAVILPAASCWTGVMLGNRILRAFTQEEFICNDTGSVFSMTFSGGVSSLAMLPEEQRNSTELLRTADVALYEAKRGGKNAIAIARSDRLIRDQDSLVQAQEKLLLFGPLSAE